MVSGGKHANSSPIQNCAYSQRRHESQYQRHFCGHPVAKKISLGRVFRLGRSSSGLFAKDRTLVFHIRSKFLASKGGAVSSPLGYLALVLHAHLPFIRHPEEPDFLQEDWFYEGVLETYAPLLLRFEKLTKEKIPFRITMHISPPLATLMEDGLLS